MAHQDHAATGRFSGRTMERLALKRLIADSGEGLIRVLLVYKVDRLTHSLADFAQIGVLFEVRGGHLRRIHSTFRLFSPIPF